MYIHKIAIFISRKGECFNYHVYSLYQACPPDIFYTTEYNWYSLNSHQILVFRTCKWQGSTDADLYLGRFGCVLVSNHANQSIRQAECLSGSAQTWPPLPQMLCKYDQLATLVSLSWVPASIVVQAYLRHSLTSPVLKCSTNQCIKHSHVATKRSEFVQYCCPSCQLRLWPVQQQCWGHGQGS